MEAATPETFYGVIAELQVGLRKVALRTDLLRRYLREGERAAGTMLSMKVCVPLAPLKALGVRCCASRKRWRVPMARSIRVTVPTRSAATFGAASA